eukprot:4614674-Ditylum_brightwellii.AAC.1
MNQVNVGTAAKKKEVGADSSVDHSVNRVEIIDVDKDDSSANAQCSSPSTNANGEINNAENKEYFFRKSPESSVQNSNRTCSSSNKSSVDLNSNPLPIETVVDNRETKTTATATTANEFDDDPFGDVIFNVEDLAAIDNIEQNRNCAKHKTVEKVIGTQQSQRVGVNVQEQEQKMLIPQSSHPPQQHQKSSNDDEFGDPFGDLPAIDFDVMDKLIEQRSSSCTLQPPPNPDAPVWNPTVQQIQNNPSDYYDDTISCPGFIQFSRFIVRSVQEDVLTCTKTLIVSPWKEGYGASNTFSNDLAGAVHNNGERKEVEKQGSIYLRGE